MSRLEGMSALVTGAGTGIGEAIACRYALEGARVTVADIDLSAAAAVRDEIISHGGSALAVEMDVSDRDAVRAGFAATRDRFGRVDVLVANAGISMSTGVFDTTAEQWMRHQRVNGIGTLLPMQEAARIMIEQGGGGKIIVLTSISGRRNNADWVAYAASKAACSSLIASGARSLARHSITVTGIAPGIVETPLWEGVYHDADARARRFASYAAEIPLGRTSLPDEMTGAAVFLATPDSDYMTGQIITLDGGITA